MSNRRKSFKKWVTIGLASAVFASASGVVNPSIGLASGSGASEEEGIIVLQDGQNVRVIDDNTKCTFHLSATSRVKFSVPSSEYHFLYFSIHEQSDNDRTIGYPILDANESEEYYLSPGTYTVRVDTYNGCSSSFNFNVFPTKDTFEEGSGYNNDTLEAADHITLGTPTTGTLVHDEIFDVYRFNAYYNGSQGIPVILDIHPRRQGEQFTYSVYSTSACPTEEQIREGNQDGAAPLYTGSVTDMSGVRMDLNSGSYYLVIRKKTKECNYYVFLNQKSSEDPTAYDTCYLTVGERGKLIPESSEDYSYNQSLFWESMDSSIVKYYSKSSGDVNALKAGKTEMFGYGTISRTSGGRIRSYNYYVKVPVVVEFSDVRHGSNNGKNPYYYDSVYWAATEGITGGVKNSETGLYDTFNPQGICTRGQMVAFLWRLAGCPEPETKAEFKDVSEKAYYYKAVSWAQEKGITGGYKDGTFRPNDQCSRGQAVSFLYRLDGMGDVEWMKSSTGTAFEDINPDDGKYYNDAVVWAAFNGITGGYPDDNTFRPNNSVTRGQMVSFLKRYHDILEMREAR